MSAVKLFILFFSSVALGYQPTFEISNFPATQVVSGTVSVLNFPATQAVTGTFWQATQPISAASLPLPTGAATAANQSTANGYLSSMDTSLLGLGGIFTGLNQEIGQPSLANGFLLLAENPSGNAVAVKSNASGELITVASGTTAVSGSVSVSNFPVSQAVTGTFWQATQPVSAASLPLPSGAATAAWQSSSDSSLTSIKTAVETLDNAISGNEMQVDVLTMPTVTVNSHNVTNAGTFAVQAAQSGSWTVSGTTTLNGSLPTGTNSIGQVTANAGTNLNTSALALETTQSAMSAKLPASLGSKTSANSMAVVVASDQGAIPVSQSGAWTISASNPSVSQTGVAIPSSATLVGGSDGANLRPLQVDSNYFLKTSQPDYTVSGTITTQNLVPTGTATSNSAVQTAALMGMSGLSVQVSGTYTGALSFQYSNDGAAWETQTNPAMSQNQAGTPNSQINSGNTGMFYLNTQAAKYFRVTALSAVTGTATVTINATDSPSLPLLPTALRVNLMQLQGNTLQGGAGTDHAGAPRTTESTAGSATFSIVNDTNASTTIVSSSSTRRNLSVWNDSTATLYLYFSSSAASTASATVKVLPDGYYEMPQPAYSGQINGIWSSDASGAARITSW
jgi:hypothetical protein